MSKKDILEAEESVKQFSGFIVDLIRNQEAQAREQSRRGRITKATLKAEQVTLLKLYTFMFPYKSQKELTELVTATLARI